MSQLSPESMSSGIDCYCYIPQLLRKILSTLSVDRDFPSTLRSLLDTTTATEVTKSGPVGDELNPTEPKKRRVKVQSNSLREVLDIVAERGEGGMIRAPPISSASLSAEALREEVIRRSDIQTTQLLSEKADQQKIDKLSLLAFLSTAADLLRLFCQFQKKSIFSLAEVTKYLSSSLRLACGSFASSSLLPQSSSNSPSHRTESLVLSMLSEVVPEYVAILPRDAAAGVNFVTVRVNLNTPMGAVRDKLRQMGEEANREKMRLVRDTNQENNQHY
jgi:hypothetical protein